MNDSIKNIRYAAKRLSARAWLSVPREAAKLKDQYPELEQSVIDTILRREFWKELDKLRKDSDLDLEV